MTFYNNFLALCRQKNVSPTAAANAIGLSNATVSRWKKGSVPFDATLHKIADYFGVTVEDLLADNEKTAPQSEDSLTEDELALIKAIRSGPQEMKDAVWAIIRAVQTK